MSIQTGSKSTMLVMIIAVIALLAIVGYAISHAPDRRTPGEKIGDAVNNVSDGFKDAGRSLENRTPGEKIGDAVKDTGESIKRSAQ